MSTLLYRLGRGAMRRRRLVAAIWLVVLVGLGLAALNLRGPTASDFSMPGTESQQARDLLDEQFSAASGATGTIALKAPQPGLLGTPQGQAVATEVTQEAATLPGVTAAVDPLTAQAISPDGQYGLIQVQFTEGADKSPTKSGRRTSRSAPRPRRRAGRWPPAVRCSTPSRRPAPPR